MALTTPKEFDSPYLTDNATPETKSLPSMGVAAVLVLLHLSPETGELAVTLTTRSKKLSSHPGDTALPGGRVDPTDPDVVFAALREANEEIDLPIEDLSQYGYLGTSHPFLSRNLLIVYPVLYIYLNSAETLFEKLKANEDEVSEIFHISLKDILDSLAAQNSPKLTHSSRDLKWIHGTPYRYHSFTNPDLLPTPLTGLTADIMISVVSLAYNMASEGWFSLIEAPDQKDWCTLIQWMVNGEAGSDGDLHSIVYKPTKLSVH
ncbi:hypothetical protein PSTG_01996 [Puccinia striiformis f. sp. tritici PST-78]|uniref:Nudix hydrolase domain-containing protein n=2 Tax=Puccinia striiformis f. sp. tritici PST-78 TaxID=1165861 RepID=A0A0L0W096_9BASI|nr:hypothetical protein PSTG_01996 [Puccinia striiformis f. sp. tritici PST-78]